MMKRFHILLFAGLVACASPSQDPPVDPPKRGAQKQEALTAKLTAKGDADVIMNVRLALTDAQRKKGLGGVKELGANEGMLFVYKDAVQKSYWMKGCHIGLDIAFLGDTGEIWDVQTMFPPKAGTPDAKLRMVTAPKAGHLVLEMPAGFFSRNGLAKGSRVHIPSDLPRHRAE